MASFYNQADQDIYTGGDHFIPQEQYRLGNFNTVAPVPPESTQQVNQSVGIPYTGAFTNSNVKRDNNQAALGPYTARPSGSFVTNRTSYGSSGYLPGTEPEENYMQKIGGMIKTGIGMAIPGGNFLMGLAENQSRQNRLSATDNAFIDMQMANQEQSMHGGNLTNQDRYGYNKESMFGNYGNLVNERVATAEKFFKEHGYYRDIDKYYNEKAKEQDEIDKQIAANDWQRQRITANKFREQETLGISPYPTGQNIHGGDDTPTGVATTIAPRHHADHSTGQGQGAYQAPNVRDISEEGPGVTASSGMHGGKHYAQGGRIVFFDGGLARLL